MNGDVLREVPGHVRRRRRRHHARACGATRPGSAASATSSAGSSSTSVPAGLPRGRRSTPGSRVHEHLTELAAEQAIGEHGLVALDWHSGNRSVLVDHELSGLVVGQTLATRPEDAYRALLEATAFGTRTIVEAFDDAGVPVTELVVAGGLLKNPLLMQIYADVTDLPLSTIGSDAGPGARLGDPRGRRGRRVPRRARRRRGDGPARPRRLPADPGERRGLRRALRRVPHAARLLRPRRQRRHAPAQAAPSAGRGRWRRDERLDRRHAPRSHALRAQVAALHAELTRYGAGRLDRRQRLGPGARPRPAGDQAVRRLLRRADRRTRWSSPTSTATLVEGEHAPSSDTAAHAYVYRHMPEVGGVVHTHSTYATAWAARGEADPVRADHDGRRVRRRHPGRPVRADRRRLDRPRHRRDPARQPLARRC